MNQRIRRIFSSKFVHNSAWLYVLQAFNTLVPMLTLPYITRVLGSSGYGAFSFSLNIIGYFKVLVDYGFELTGSRRIVLAKNNDEISKIFTSVTLAKIGIMLFSFISFILLSSIFKINSNEKSIVYILFFMVLGSTIQQTWLFQGLQEMKFITIVSVISRTVSVFLIFLLVKNPNHVNLYTLIYSLTFLINGICSLLIVKYKFNISLMKITILDIIFELKEGWYIFSTSFASKIFAGVGITVLGLTATNSVVGIYSAIYKVPSLIIIAYAPFGQVLYPFISKKYLESFENGYEIILKLIKISTIVLIIIFIVFLKYSKNIIEVFFGPEYSVFHFVAIPLLIWASFSIINNLIGIQVLVASGHHKEYAILFRKVIFINIFLNVSFGYFYGMYGVAIAAMISECVLTFLLVFKIRKIRLYFSQK